jgi:hypothetical protein
MTNASQARMAPRLAPEPVAPGLHSCFVDSRHFRVDRKTRQDHYRRISPLDALHTQLFSPNKSSFTFRKWRAPHSSLQYGASQVPVNSASSTPAIEVPNLVPAPYYCSIVRSKDHLNFHAPCNPHWYVTPALVTMSAIGEFYDPSTASDAIHKRASISIP